MMKERLIMENTPPNNSGLPQSPTFREQIDNVSGLPEGEREGAMGRLGLEIRGAADVVLPEVGVTPPGWWHPELGAWERVDRDPKERMTKGAARAILYYDDELRYIDKERDGDLGRNSPEYQKQLANYETALRDFEKYSEQSRLYKRNAQVVELVEQFNDQEEEALKVVPNADIDKVRLNIYERDRLRKELDKFNEHKVGRGLERHGLYSKEQWDRAIERKEELEDRVPKLESEINAKIDPNYLGRRDAKRTEIDAAKILADKEREAEEEENRELVEESDWEKQLGIPEMPAGYKSFVDVARTREKQDILKNKKEELKTQRDRAREREVRKEIAQGRDPRTIDLNEIDGLPAEIIDRLQELSIDLDGTEMFDQNKRDEANKAADRLLFERGQIGAFENLIQPIITECVTVAEAIYERPDQFLDIDFLRQAEQIANAQSTGPYAGERGEYIRRAFRNIQKLIDEVVTSKETDVNNFELTPGINWKEIRETLIEGKKWYSQSEFGTFRFNDQSATTLRTGVAQFRYDIVHGSNYYDQQQMLGDMQAFTKALRIINIERLAKREGWTRDEAIRFRDSLRHEGENGISFTLMKFWGDAVMMPQMNGFYTDYWAKEGPGRLEDLLKEHDGYFSLATHLLHTKYKMMYNLEAFRGGLLGKTQVQGNLRDVYQKLLIEDMMEWELVGVKGDDRDKLIELRKKTELSAKERRILNELSDKSESELTADERTQLNDLKSKEEQIKKKTDLTDEEREELKRLETKARQDLTTCQSEDEVIDRFRPKEDNLKEEMNQAEKDYKDARDALGKRVESRDDKYVLKREGSEDSVSPQEEEIAIQNLQRLRKNYTAAKQRHDKVEQKAKDGLELALQVDHVFGEAYELGPRKVRMENGDLLSIRDIDKVFRFAAVEDAHAQEAFKAKYGFKDNLALQRERASEWNGGFAEYKAILGFWKYLDDISQGRGGMEHLKEKEKKWISFYKSIIERWQYISERGTDQEKDKLKRNGLLPAKMTPYQRILQLVPEEAKESFVKISVTTDEKDPNAIQKNKRFDLAKGYEYTGFTAEQLPFIQRAWNELNRNGDNAVIGGRRFRDIKNMTELEDVESFFLGRYMGTREGQDSEDAIEGSLTGELPWLNKNRAKLAQTGRRGFVGSEHLTGTPQQKNNQYIAAISDTVYCDRVDGILAYQFATTDTQGRFTPDQMTQGVPWNGTWGGNIELDYPGYGITNIRKVIGRFPKILRGAPIREPSLARYIGFNGLHEAVGNKMFNPTDPWVFETWGKVKDAGQKFQAYYATGFDEALRTQYRISDKLLEDGDATRIIEHPLLGEHRAYSLEDIIVKIMLGFSRPLNETQEEEVMIKTVGGRYERITLVLGPQAAMFQNFRGAEDSRLGLEMNDLFHNSFILPTLLSPGEGPERWQESGLDANEELIPYFALLSLPKGWGNRDNFIGHYYRKGRQGRDSGKSKSPILVRS